MRFCPVFLSLALTAQAFAAQAPAFEVASVRLAPGPGITSQRMTDSRVDLTLINLRALLLLAFRAKGYELVGPDWLAETRVSIQATLPAGATRRQVPEMLQRLLAERFHLVVHREPRPMEVYELVVGPGGHKMREVDPVDELDKTFSVSKAAEQFREQFGTAAALDSVQDTPDGPVRTVIGDDLGRTTLTSRTMYKLTLNMDRLGRRTQTLDATRITMTELAAVLMDVTGQPVLDKTGLRGMYQFGGVELPINAAVLKLAREAIARAGGTFEAPYVSEAKAIEGLGLRLERRRSPIDVIVVDSIDRTPTAN
jgi:uncharacterized protein (TIGR03435 family)